jgi:ABC-type phosphate/phosphonate transport system substrate-binding protein
VSEVSAVSQRIAVLGMYAFPELHDAWDALYADVAARVGGAPARLTWEVDAHDTWLDPNLAIGMACGWPLIKTLCDQVKVVGTFSYTDTPGPAPMYRSVIVTGGDLTFEEIARDPADHRAALNSLDSLSGNISLLAAFGLGLEWPGESVFTGAHLSSIEAVRSGAVDVAAIDGMTWAYRQREALPTLAGLRVIGHGPLLPCLPLIVPASASDAQIVEWRSAFASSVGEPRLAESLRRLMIRDFVPLDASDYGSALAELMQHHLQPA